MTSGLTDKRLSLPMPVITSSVLQGNTLRSVWDTGVSGQTSTRYAVGEQGKDVLRAFLRRKRIVSRLVSVANSGNEEDKAVESEKDKMTKTTYSPLERPIRMRNPKPSLQKATTPSQTCSLSTELVKESSKDSLHRGFLTPVRTIQQEIALTCELLHSKKVNLREHYRYKSQISVACERIRGTNTISCPRPRQIPRLEVDFKPSSEQMDAVYAMMSQELARLMLSSNGAQAHPASTYKCYIGPGNNSQLVFQTLHRRPYWLKTDDWTQADFIWTSTRLRKISRSLPQFTGKLTVVKGKWGKHGPVKRVTRLLMEQEREKSGVKLIAGAKELVSVGSGVENQRFRVYNRLERNYQLTSKKRLYLNLKQYCILHNLSLSQFIPPTFHLQPGVQDSEFTHFEAAFQAESALKSTGKSMNLWIVKPGEGTNCGHGIHISEDYGEILGLISSKNRTYIVQKYIENPLLINNRKFDIRCYGLITSVNSHIQGYFYHEGYIRTSSKPFNLHTHSKFVHLTNDAVQKKGENYGLFEPGNKLSYSELAKLISEKTNSKVDFKRDIWSQIKFLVFTTFQATFTRLDPKKRLNSFEILGYDFMVDEDYKVWLIEVNTNPCLALSSALLARIIPNMLENAFKLVLDPYFPEPEMRKKQEKDVKNRFELVFSSCNYEKTADLSGNEQSSGESEV